MASCFGMTPVTSMGAWHTRARSTHTTAPSSRCASRSHITSLFLPSQEHPSGCRLRSRNRRGAPEECCISNNLTELGFCNPHGCGGGTSSNLGRYGFVGSRP
jgi:hypothetical protein